MKMEIPILSTLLVFVMFFSCQQNTTTETVSGAPIDTGYDSLKAAKYGADDYGMKKYVMAFLYSGANQDISADSAAVLQGAHMENIMRMAEEGTLVVAGPFFGKGELRGIYIFDVQSIADAEALTNTDPAIQAGSLRMELLEWYGSAALLDLKDVHKTLAKKSM